MSAAQAQGRTVGPRGQDSAADGLGWDRKHGNMRYQQKMAGRPFALIVLVAPDNTIETLLPLMPQVLEALPSVVPGQIVKIAAQHE